MTKYVCMYVHVYPITILCIVGIFADEYFWLIQCMNPYIVCPGLLGSLELAHSMYRQTDIICSSQADSHSAASIFEWRLPSSVTRSFSASLRSSDTALSSKSSASSQNFINTSGSSCCGSGQQEYMWERGVTGEGEGLTGEGREGN